MKFQEEAIHRTKLLHQKNLSDLESVLDRPGSSITKLNKPRNSRWEERKTGLNWWNRNKQQRRNTESTKWIRQVAESPSGLPTGKLGCGYFQFSLVKQSSILLFLLFYISNLSSCYDSFVKKDMPSVQQKFASLLWNTSFSIGCDILYSMFTGFGARDNPQNPGLCI